MFEVFPPDSSLLAEQRAQLSRVLACAKFPVQHAVQLPIERRAVGPAIEHRQVIRVLPIVFGAQLLPDRLMKFCARQRVGNGHADFVWETVTDHLAGAFDVLEALARVAELQKKADLNTRIVQPLRGAIDLLDPRALLHRVQNFLRAGLGAHPHDLATRSLETLNFARALEQIDPA